MGELPGGRVLLTVAAKVLALYLFLIAVPPFGHAFAQGYRVAFDAMADVLPIERELSLHLAKVRRPGIDAYVSVKLPSGEEQESIPIDIRNHSYIATSFVIAVLVALPLGWRRNAIAVTAALLLVWGGFLAGFGSTLTLAFGADSLSLTATRVTLIIRLIFGLIPWYFLTIASCVIGLALALSISKPAAAAPDSSGGD